MMKSLALCLVLVCVGFSAVQAAEAFVHPVLRVPKLAAPPVIDGAIDDAEWGRAAAFTGVTAEGSVGGHGSLVPRIQQVQWFLGYDDTYLYMAMRSPHPEGTYPVARVKEDDLIIGHPAVLFEDHVEIQILTHGRRDQASTQGKGFYKVMANPKAAIVDEFLFNGTDGTEQLWAMGGPVKCRVTKSVWELELAIEIGRLDIASLDARDLVIQLVRTDSCTGMYFAGLVGTHWMDWQRFARMDFVPGTPVCRFLQLGEIGAGELDAVIELVGGSAASQVTLELRVEDADGKVVHEESREVALPANHTERLSFQKQGIAISTVAVAERNRRNHLEIKAIAQVDGESIVLFHNRSPFMQMDEEFRRQFLDKWIAGRPQSGEWEYKIAYLPYSDKLEVSVDLDFFGMSEQVQSARRFQVAVSAKGQEAVLATGGGPIEGLVGAPILMDLPKLGTGEYVASFQLFDGSGSMISAKDAAFVRKEYPWEHNQLGMSDEVIPPFQPLTVRERTVGMWGRSYTIAPGGLPGQIVVGPPTGSMGQPLPLLAAPVRLDVRRGDGIATVADAESEIASAAMHRVDIRGSQQLGEIAADLTSFVEYDGWWEFAATLEGAGTIETADLVIDLKDQPGLPIDTLYVQRLGDGRYGNHFNAIPREPGIHFQSTELLKVKGSRFDWKSFVPQTYIGSGDRGLWFFAWSAAGWELADEQPVVQVERLEDGNVRLRVRLLAGPVELNGARTMRFALQAAPVKPNHPRYRTYNEEGLDAHDTRGYRYYGKSVDDFVNSTPEEYEALRQFVLYGPRYQGEAQRTAKGNYGWWHGHYVDKLAHGAKLVMYGSGQLTGMGPGEFRSFGGEWLGRSNWVANRSAASDTGRWNYQGTEQWDSDEELSVTGINWSQSMIDFFIWYHKPLLEKSGFNGTWWDNVSISLVNDYNAELGRLEEVWLLYPRRQLVKRLNTLGWELMRPPLWAANMHVDLGFAQIFWMVENDWYADGADMTSLQQWPIGQFRAMARTKSTMQVARPWLSGFTGTTPERDEQVRRSLWAMLMSHDIHPAVLSHYTFAKEEFLPVRRTMSRMRGLVNLADTTNCLFAGYWLTAGMVEPAVEQVHASVYSNAGLRTAAVLFFNGDTQAKDLAGTGLEIDALIPVRGKRLQVRQIFDLESGEPVAFALQDNRYVLTAPLSVEGHGFRLLGVEAE